MPVQLVSSFTGLDSITLLHKNDNIYSCLVQSKPGDHPYSNTSHYDWCSLVRRFMFQDRPGGSVNTVGGRQDPFLGQERGRAEPGVGEEGDQPRELVRLGFGASDDLVIALALNATDV